MGTCAKEGPVLILLATRDGPNIAKYLIVKLCSVLHFSRPATPEAFADGPKRTCLISIYLKPANTFFCTLGIIGVQRNG